MRRMARWTGMHALGAVVLMLAACNVADNLVEQRRPRLGVQNVIGEAAAALATDGTFEMPRGVSLNGDRIIDDVQARRLALAFLRTFGQSFRSTWEADRGGSVNLARLGVSSRVFFAQSPYAAFPNMDVHPAYRRQYGPYYLVTLIDGAEPIVAMAVSALATDYGIDASGLLVSPKHTGMDFLHEGISTRPGAYRPISPEEAAETVASSTGARVSRVPELVLVGRENSPTLARWHVQVDRSLHLRDALGTVRAS